MAKKDILYCRGCEAPLAEKDGGVIRVVKFYKSMELPVEIDINYEGSGVVQINCERCRDKITGHTFVTLRHPTFVQRPVDKKH